MCDDVTQEKRRVSAYWDGHKQGGIDALSIALNVINNEPLGEWTVESIIKFLQNSLITIKTTP